MKRFLCIMLVLSLLVGLCGCKKKESKIEGRGFDTPEEAVLAYMEALKSCDISRILSTFSVETFVDNCNMKGTYEAINGYTPRTLRPLVNTDECTRDINLIHRQMHIADGLRNMYLTVVLDGWEDTSSFRPGEDSEYEDINELISDMENTDWIGLLAELNVDTANIHKPEEVIDDYNDSLADKIEKLRASRREIISCDDITERVVDVTIDGVDYYLCMEVTCYDGRWYNSDQENNVVTMIISDFGGHGGLARRVQE